MVMVVRGGCGEGASFAVVVELCLMESSSLSEEEEGRSEVLVRSDSGERDRRDERDA